MRVHTLTTGSHQIKLITTKRGILKYMAVPNRQKMTIEKKTLLIEIVDNLNSAKPIHKKIAEDVESQLL